MYTSALRARRGDEDVLGEFHQGLRASACNARPNIRLRPITLLNVASTLLAKPGGAHIKVYNEKRVHSGIDYLTPSELEERIKIDPSLASRFVLQL